MPIYLYDFGSFFLNVRNVLRGLNILSSIHLFLNYEKDKTVFKTTLT
jgi:hypothetical protein